MVSSVFLILDYLLGRPEAIVLTIGDRRLAPHLLGWSFRGTGTPGSTRTAEAEDEQVSDGDPTPSGPAA